MNNVTHISWHNKYEKPEPGTKCVVLCDYDLGKELEFATWAQQYEGANGWGFQRVDGGGFIPPSCVLDWASLAHDIEFPK